MKIKDLESKFYVKDNRVTCVMTGIVYVPEIDTVSERIVNYLTKITSNNCTRMDYEIIYTSYSLKVVARATCSKEDTFDEKIGTRLALAKAKAKMDRVLVSLNDFVARLFMEVVTKSTNDASKYQKDRNHQLAYIKNF